MTVATEFLKGLARQTLRDTALARGFLELAAPDFSGGAMLCLEPPLYIAEMLELPGGLAPSEMHMTLAYVGDAALVDQAALNAAAQALQRGPVIEAVISGVARFTTTSGLDPVVYTVDSPQLEQLRVRALMQLRARGVQPKLNHGFTPHITAAYVDSDEPTPADRVPPDLRVRFSAITAQYGTVSETFPFSGEPVKLAGEYRIGEAKWLANEWKGHPGGGWTEEARLHALEERRIHEAEHIPSGRYHVKNGPRIGKAYMVVHPEGHGTYVNSRGEQKPLTAAQVKKQHAGGMNHKVDELSPGTQATPPPAPVVPTPEPGPESPKDRHWRTEKTRYTRAEAQPFVDQLNREMPKGSDYMIGGSWRRGAPTVGDLDVMVVTPSARFDDPPFRFPEFAKFDPEKSRKGAQMAQGDMVIGDQRMHIDFWAASPEQRGAFTMFITGPKDLNIAQRARAKSMGFSLSQVGLLDSNGVQVDDGTEEDIYRKLQMEWIPPDKRQNYVAAPIDSRADVKQWVVPNSAGNGTYTVTRQGDRWKCNDPSYKFSHAVPKTCKHIQAIQESLKKPGTEESTPTVPNPPSAPVQPSRPVVDVKLLPVGGNSPPVNDLVREAPGEPQELTRDQQKAIDAYTQPDVGREVNAALREGRRASYKNIDDPDIDPGTMAASKVAPALDSAMRPQPTARVMYRGVNVPAGAASVEAGTEYLDPGFVSVTSDRSFAKTWADEGVEVEKLFGRSAVEARVQEVHVPAGALAVAGAPDASELILARGSRFQYQADGSVRVVVPDAPAPPAWFKGSPAEYAALQAKSEAALDKADPGWRERRAAQDKAEAERAKIAADTTRPLTGDALWSSREGESTDMTVAEKRAAMKIWYRDNDTNGILRGNLTGSGFDTPQLRGAVVRNAPIFTALIHRSPAFTRPAVTTRSIGRAEKVFGPTGSMVGKVFTDKGFQSVTSDPDISYGAGLGGVEALVRVHMPAGTHALKAVGGLGGGAGGGAEMREYTLPPGTSYKILSDREVTAERHGRSVQRRVIDVEVDPASTGPTADALARTQPLTGPDLWHSAEGELPEGAYTLQERRAAMKIWYHDNATNEVLRGSFMDRKSKTRAVDREGNASPELQAKVDAEYEAYKQKTAAEVAKKSPVFTSLIHRSPAFTRPALMYRGMSNVGEFFGPVGSMVGESVEDKGYQSLASNEGNAHTFSGFGTETGMLRVHVPAGTHALKALAKGGKDLGEYTLPPGTRFKVLSDRVDTVEEWGNLPDDPPRTAARMRPVQRRVVDVEVDPASTGPPADTISPDPEIAEEQIVKAKLPDQSKLPAPRPGPPAASSDQAKKFLPMVYNEISVDDLPQYEADPKWAFQQKIDGMRGALVIEPGKTPWVKAKHGGKFASTTGLKTLTPMLAKMKEAGLTSPDGKTRIMEGEVLNGKFNVFDIVTLGEESTPWSERMAEAERWVKIMNDAGISEPVALPTARTTAEKQALHVATFRAGSEGLVLKRLTAPYTQSNPTMSKRTFDVIKAKYTSTADVVVTDRNVGETSGVDRGAAKENALFAVWDNGKLVPVGGTSMRGMEKKYGKVKVGDVIEVAYLWASKDNMLNQPRMVGKRPDKKPEETNLSQLRRVNKSVLDKAVLDAGKGGAVTNDSLATETSARAAEKGTIRGG